VIVCLAVDLHCVSIGVAFRLIGNEQTLLLDISSAEWMPALAPTKKVRSVRAAIAERTFASWWVSLRCTHPTYSVLAELSLSEPTQDTSTFAIWMAFPGQGRSVVDVMMQV